MATNFDFINSYFTEEKVSASIMIILGSISVLLSLFFLLIIKYSFFKGLAVPMLLIGCIQCAVGSVIVTRTSKDINRVEYQLRDEPQKIKSEELPRMEIVLNNFALFKWVEILLMIVGVFLLILFFNSTQTFWQGLGLGLFLMAGILFTLDFAAEKRAELYVDFLLKAV